MDKPPCRPDDVTVSSTVLSPLSSCLRNRNKNRQNLSNRTVSFPDEDDRIVTGYLEPVNPWLFAESTTKEAVLSSYIRSCEKHGVNPVRSVLVQLEGLPYDEGNERFDSLDLRYENLQLGSCEALEEVFKRVQFEKLNLENTGLDDEASVALFDMIEYYEATTSLNISNNTKIGSRGWQECSRMLKRTKCLEQLECRNTPLDESLIPPLSRALRVGTHLQVLKLEKCFLAGRPIVILAGALKLNTTLKELYLAENDFTSVDAVQLSGLLKSNLTLQLLDLSNNMLEDAGVGLLCDALCAQTQPTGGLGILVLWNNRLSSGSAPHFNNALKTNNILEMLNVGHNQLKDEFLTGLIEGLTINRNLLRLGMQSTLLTSAGAITLSQIMNGNPNLQRIDLRDNNLQVAGLAALAKALKSNTSITQLDIDDSSKKSPNDDTMEDYIALVEETRNYCQRNECGDNVDGVEEDLTLRDTLCSIAARKISLTCDTSMMNRLPQPPPPTPSSQSLHPQCSSFLQVDTRKGRLRSPAPSPIPSPVACSSPTRTRFQVSKVSEDSSSDNEFFGSRNMRFRVTPVNSIEGSPPPVKLQPVQVVVSREASPTPQKKLPPPPQAQPPPPQPQPPPPQPQPPPSAAADSTPPRSRKLSSWMSPIFPESKVTSAGIEKLLGLFQNPFGIRGGCSDYPEAQLGTNTEIVAQRVQNSHPPSQVRPCFCHASPASISNQTPGSHDQCDPGSGPPNEETSDSRARHGDNTNNNAAMPTPIIVSQISSDEPVPDIADAGESGGATWPQASSLLRSPASTPIQSATSAPCLTAMAAIKPTG